METHYWTQVLYTIQLTAWTDAYGFDSRVSAKTNNQNMLNNKNFCKKCPLKELVYSTDKTNYKLEITIRDAETESWGKEYKAEREKAIKSYNERHRFQCLNNCKTLSPEGYIENTVDYFKDDAERKGWVREIAEGIAGYMIANKYIIVAEEVNGEFYLKFDKKETCSSPKEIKVTFN